MEDSDVDDDIADEVGPQHLHRRVSNQLKNIGDKLHTTYSREEDCDTISTYMHDLANEVLNYIIFETFRFVCDAVLDLIQL
jgi:hypothetical protein